MKIIRRLITLVGKRVNNSLILNAMAKTYSKTPKTDTVQMVIDALFSNTFPTGTEMHEKSQHICENLLILLKRLVNGHRFKRKHFEDLYHKALERDTFGEDAVKNDIYTDDAVSVRKESDYKQTSNDGSDKKSSDSDSNYYGERLAITYEIINTMIASDVMMYGPQNFIYFNGYGSGITTFKKKFDKSPFNKAFCFCAWFRLEELDFSTVDYCPILFSFFQDGVGGFECYFVQNQLFYRILPTKYSQPNENSSGVLIGEFDPEEWHYVAISHEKKFLGRSDVRAVVNNKQVLSVSMDFPRGDKLDQFDHAWIARHFCGQLSTCIIFRESVSSDKLKKINNAYPYGLYKRDHVNMLNESAIFETKLLSRIELLYTPVRSTPNVGVWDLIGNNFGSLEANSGIWVEEDFRDQFLFCGGLNGLLPLLNLLKNRIHSKEQGMKLLHRYLEIISLTLRSAPGQADMKLQFIKAFFLLLEHLPRDFFQIKTIQQLAEIRFSLPHE